MRDLFHIARRIMIFSLIGTCCIICNSCTIKARGFSLGYSTTGASTPAGAKTFSVQHFENLADNVETGFSQQVTDALKDYIQNNTGLILVTGKGDVDFEGSITGFSIRPVSIESGDVASKNRFTITLAVTYTCDETPDNNFNSSFSRYEDYSSNSDFESVKDDLSENILKLLVEDIFNKAFVNW
jgi:hypothetical protein